MFEPFECQCIYVEMSNERVPRSGRIEYRAAQCPLCRVKGAILAAERGAPVAIDPHAPRYQRPH